MVNGLVTHSAVGVVLHGTKISNSTNPYVVRKNVTLILADACLPSQVKYTARCIMFVRMCGYWIWSLEPFSKIAFLSLLHSLLI